ncbi:LysR family transcriptional regulator [Pantoea phytobeneficialis]|uniref:LysR family transcriptional regulator n=1 Tax=Pantoea phytobeneficialis TaxID=2052056 RepID=A0AAP9H4Y1_9GAMM|nr:LysR family transcriptional regulator [Pantoea phytobeneficialis]MDO6405632.1 LysR family transcriptional regulator [Pantoea phytobeneficialis]QGR06723.1 LysR family transcriptional regulator [Pantoea phytobeneficialis]
MNTINIESLDLNLFKVFEALYEEGSASRAALRLGITQSAVSAALGRLRKIYGDPMFERTGRGLRPSRRAEELKPIVSEALNRCRQSLALAQREQAEFEGRTLVLGWSDDYEIALARQLINRVAEAYPGLRLIFRQIHSRIAAGMLMNRMVDLAVTSGSGNSAALSKELVGVNGYACVLDFAPPTGELTLSDYTQLQHILISSGGVVGIVDEVLAELGLKRTVEAAATHFSAVPYLIKGSRSIVTLPSHAAQAMAMMFDLRLVHCPIALPDYPIELSWRTDSLRDPAVAGVRNILRELLKAIPPVAARF